MSVSETGRFVATVGELLPYEEIEENRLYMRNGAIAHCLEIGGFYGETMTNEALNSLHLGLHTLLNSLPDEDVTYQLYWVRSDRLGALENAPARAEGSLGAKLAAARRALWEESAATGKTFEVRAYLIVNQGPPQGGRPLKWSRTVRALLSPEAISEDHERQHRDALEKAQQTEKEVIEAAEKAGLRPRRVSEGELFRLLWHHLNPDRALTPPPTIDGRTPYDIPQVDLGKEWRYLRLGDTYLRVITLRRLPDETFPGILRGLTSIPVKAWLSVNWRRAPRAAEMARLQVKRNLAEALRQGTSHNVKAEVAVEDALYLEKQLVAGDEAVHLAEWILIVAASSPGELAQTTQKVLMAFRSMNGAEGLAESAANLKLWLSSMPGNSGGEGDFRFHRVITRNLADLLPVMLPYSGSSHPVIHFGTTENTLAGFNPFDRQLPNYNALVFGASGGGKSFLVQYLCMHILSTYPDARLIFIDKGGSYHRFVSLFGGQSFNVAASKRYGINPLAVEPFEEKRAYLTAVLSTMLLEQGRSVDNDERLVIEQALDWARGRSGKLSIGSVAQAFRTMPTEDALSKEISGRFARYLERWTCGLYGDLLNNESSRLAISSDITAIDLKGLESYPDMMVVFLLYITEMIWSACQKEPSRRKIIVFDEVWSMLSTEAGGRLVSELYRTLRKYGAGIISVSQGLSDFELTQHSSGIMANVGTVYVLKQSSTVNSERVFKALNVTTREAELIRQLGQVKGEYAEVLVTGSTSFVGRIWPSPLEYWVATSDPVDHSALEAECPGEPTWEAVERLAARWPKGVM